MTAGEPSDRGGRRSSFSPVALSAIQVANIPSSARATSGSTRTASSLGAAHRWVRQFTTTTTTVADADKEDPGFFARSNMTNRSVASFTGLSVRLPDVVNAVVPPRRSPGSPASAYRLAHQHSNKTFSSVDLASIPSHCFCSKYDQGPDVTNEIEAAWFGGSTGPSDAFREAIPSISQGIPQMTASFAAGERARDAHEAPSCTPRVRLVRKLSGACITCCRQDPDDRSGRQARVASLLQRAHHAPRECFP